MTTKPLSYALRPNGAVLGMRWLVLMVILFGTVLSSVGGTNSHGLADLAAKLCVAPFSCDGSHEQAHEHEASELTTAHHGADADHPHHGADHSHDKAHALPVAWSSPAPQLHDWVGRVRPWIEMVQASRRDRPPMG